MAIELDEGTNEGMYYDDKIIMKICNYQGAVACLELMHGKTKHQIEKMGINVNQNVDDQTWSKTMRKLKAEREAKVSTRERNQIKNESCYI